MGMGSAACHATTISLENLRGLCPDELGELEKALEQEGLSLHEFALDSSAQSLEMEDGEPVGEKQKKSILVAWATLCSSFEAKTRVGDSHLFLDIGSYDPDSGDRYDDFESDETFYFEVWGHKQLSPAGEAFQHLLKDKTWTQYC